jgi:hypothetical protein
MSEPFEIHRYKNPLAGKIKENVTGGGFWDGVVYTTYMSHPKSRQM